MQFVPNGPDVPEPLVQAHEEGRVVFFCGSGISYPAGLPGFQGLVDRIYEKLGTTRKPIEDKAYENQLFDATLDQLERRLPGGRYLVRSALADALTPKLGRGATDSHVALLQLARDRNGTTRLVTTNFDRIFQRVIERRKMHVPHYPAPLLPIPKDSRWNGVVYLHGLLPKQPDPRALNNLVVTSGDFGLAYLTERWASRFVGELFRNYVVCFVGYSINDPVLRYMMDALAADRMLGEITPEAYSFGPYESGGMAQELVEWQAKGVIPILYELPATNPKDHSAMHRTLKAWSETYRDGVSGKERIVSELALARPQASTLQDNFVKRLLWALSDSTGEPAKLFADFNPAPSLDWLIPLCAEGYCQADLPRFGVAPLKSKDEKLAFSLLRRPSPYTLAPPMAIILGFGNGTRWDAAMTHLARWLTRHLDDPALVLWLAGTGGLLHDSFATEVERALTAISKSERSRDKAILDSIRQRSPRAIPRRCLRGVWRVILSGRLKSPWREHDPFQWIARFNRDGLTPNVRWELRELLSPRAVLREPFRAIADHAKGFRKKRGLQDLIEWEVVLSGRHVASAMRDLRKNRRWRSGLPGLLGDFSTLLRDMLDLKRELGGAVETSDLSYVHRPSIAAHTQNHDFQDWTVLVDLARDSWLAVAKRDSDQASSAAEGWWRVPYPLFKRLAFFAAAQGTSIPSARALDWIESKNGWWLWSEETQVEVLRLLATLVPRLSRGGQRRLERTILNGPPRAMYGKKITAERWQEIVDWEVWSRLVKFDSAGAVLSARAQKRLSLLALRFQLEHPPVDDRNEFPFWMGEGEDRRMAQTAPRDQADLIEWLQGHDKQDAPQGSNWRTRCREDFASTSSALCTLANVGQWPAERWQEALQAWGEKPHLTDSWCKVGPVVALAPEGIWQEIVGSVAWWLYSIAPEFEGNDELFLATCKRVLTVDRAETVDQEDPIGQAINHPIGLATEALLRAWHRGALEDGQGLQTEFRLVFSLLCDPSNEKFRLARVILARRVISLFRVDQAWTREFLLPRFDWAMSESEARAMWKGFLWSPRVYRPLLEALRPAFLQTSARYGQLGQYGASYAAVLTFLALDRGDAFSSAELTEATGDLPPEGAREVVQALLHALEGASDKRAEYWSNRIAPYLHAVWPKASEFRTPSVSESMALLCIAADAAFPKAFSALRVWLQQLEQPHYVVGRLAESDLCSRYPMETLEFLNLIINDQTRWLPIELRRCLDAIESARPALVTNEGFKKLTDYLRRHG
jgi:hypothetical protein